MTKWRSFGMLLFFIGLCLLASQVKTVVYGYFSLTPFAAKIYLLMALSAWLVWRKQKPDYKIALVAWSVQLVLTCVWQSFNWARIPLPYLMAEVALIWIVVLVTIILFFKHSKFATFFMTLYFLLVSFSEVVYFLMLRKTGA